MHKVEVLRHGWQGLALGVGLHGGVVVEDTVIAFAALWLRERVRARDALPARSVLTTASVAQGLQLGQGHLAEIASGAEVEQATVGA